MPRMEKMANPPVREKAEFPSATVRQTRTQSSLGDVKDDMVMAVPGETIEREGRHGDGGAGENSVDGHAGCESVRVAEEVVGGDSLEWGVDVV